MSEPIQEAVPGFVVGSDLAEAWSCGCTAFPMTSAEPLSFSDALLFMVFNMSTSLSPACTAETVVVEIEHEMIPSLYLPAGEAALRLGRHLKIGLRKPSVDALQIGVDGR